MKWICQKYVITAVLLLGTAQSVSAAIIEDEAVIEFIEGSSLFLAVDVGMQRPDLKDRITVNNGSGFPAPSDVDTLSTHEKKQALVAASIGRRWQRDSQWFPAYSLGLRYKYVFPEDMGDTVTQYSLPAFTNYNYKLKVSSNVLLAATKVNLFNFARLSPYLNGGAGVAFNHTSSYSETALPSVTARVSPGFDSHTQNEFAYSVGFGLDFLASPQWVMSVGYEYQNFGKVSSGHGNGSWSNQSLNLGTYESNAVLLSMSYFFDNK